MRQKSVWATAATRAVTVPKSPSLATDQNTKKTPENSIDTTPELSG